MSDFEKAKESLFVRLMPNTYEAPICKSASEFGFEDLILVPYIDHRDFSPDDITHEMISSWDVTEKEIFDTAMENTKKVAVQKTVVTLMEELFPWMEIDASTYEGQIAITNKSRRYGAAGIIAFIDEFKKIYKDGFYVLPSSIHEVMVVPKVKDKSELDHLVREINAYELTPDAVLGYHVYEF